jgi:outer membrane protein assembly factor BamB
MNRTPWAVVAFLAAGCANAADSAPRADPPAASSPAAPPRTAAGTPGTDWPTFLGPTQDNVSTEKGILTVWPKEGLGKVWDCPLGVGFAPPVVADGKLFHFDRFGDACRLTCRDAATGKAVWQFEYPTTYEDIYGYDPGPRACPVVDGDRVYILGPEGVLHCVRVADGTAVWKVDTRAKYHYHQNFFGVGSVPVVDGDLLIVAVGGSPKGPRPADLRDAKPDGTGIVAFDKKTGAVKYQTADELASYSSPVVRTIGGKKVGLYFARGGLVGFDPQTGAVGFHYKWRSKLEESVNAANPLVVGDRILLTECYGPGAALLEVKDGKPKAVWTDDDKDKADKALMCHWNTPVHHAGFVYGSSGRHDNEADLRCVELATGDVKWRERRTYRCTLLLVDGHLLSLSEYGDLALLKVNPEKYDEVAKYKVPEVAYPSWAPPVLSRGLLYLRGKERLVCLELIPQKK